MGGMLSSIVIVFAGCTHKKELISSASRMQEASMSQLPLPVGGTLLPSRSNAGSVIVYAVSADRNSLSAYYEKEMVRLGWRKVTQYRGLETLLIYENPLSIALIKIEDARSRRNSKSLILSLYKLSKERNALVDEEY